MDRASGAGAAMLAVPLPEAEVRAAARRRRCRSPRSTPTTSASSPGPADAIDGAAAAARRPTTSSPTLIPLAAAAHSSLLDPILPEFLERRAQVELSPPAAAVPVEPDRHVDHRRAGHRPAVLGRPPPPHGALRRLPATRCWPTARSCSSRSARATRCRRTPAARPSSRSPPSRPCATPTRRSTTPRSRCSPSARRWAAGVDVDLDRFTGDGPAPRAPARATRSSASRHWIEPGRRRARRTGAVAAVERGCRRRVRRPPSAPAPTRIPDLADSFWAPTWVERAPAAPAAAPIGPWLVVGDADRPARRRPRPRARRIAARRSSGHAVAAPGRAHRGPLASCSSGRTDGFDAAVDRWLTTASAVARALGDVDGEPTLLAAVTRGATDAGGHGRRTRPTPWRSASSAPHRASTPTCARVLVDLDAEPATRPSTPRPSSPSCSAASDHVVARRGPPARADDRAHRASTRRRRRHVPPRRQLPRDGRPRRRRLRARPSTSPTSTRPTSSSSPAGPCPRAPSAASGSPATATTTRRAGASAASAELESLGTKVTVVAADLADPDVRAGGRRGGRAPGRPARRRDPRRRRAPRPADRAGHARGPRGRRRRQGARRARPRRRAAPARRRAARAHLVDVDRAQRRRPGRLRRRQQRPRRPRRHHGDLRVVTINYGLWAELGIAADAAHRARLGIERRRAGRPPGALRAAPSTATARSALVGTLATEHHWVVDEHRTPAGIAAAARHRPPRAVPRRRRAAPASAAPRSAPVTLLEPLVVPDGVAGRPSGCRSRAGDGRPRWAQLESDGGVGAWRAAQRGRARRRRGRRGADARRARPPRRRRRRRPARPAGVAARARARGGARSSRRGATATTVGGTIAPRRAVRRRARRVAGPSGARRRGDGVRGAARRARAVAVRAGRLRRASAATARSRRAPWVPPGDCRSSTDELLRVDLTLGRRRRPRRCCAIDGLALRPIDEPAALAAADRRRRPPAHRPATSRRPARRPRRGSTASAPPRAPSCSSGCSRRGRPRLIASSIDLAELLALVDARAGSRAARRRTAPAPAAGGDHRARHDPRDLGRPARRRRRRRRRRLLRGRRALADRHPADVADRTRSSASGSSWRRSSTRRRSPALAAKVLEARPDLDAELRRGRGGSTRHDRRRGRRPAPARAATGAADRRPHQSLVTISPTGDKAPLFIVHGAGGNVLFLWSLARAMAGSPADLRLPGHGVDGHDMPDATIEEMAAPLRRRAARRAPGPVPPRRLLRRRHRHVRDGAPAAGARRGGRATSCCSTACRPARPIPPS